MIGGAITSEILFARRADGSLPGWKTSAMLPDADRIDHVGKIIDMIEEEMKDIDYWHAEPLPDEAFHFQQAFAMDTMTFPQWLQFILIPRVQEALAKPDGFPKQSMVGIQAIREFDGNEKATRLVQLLNDFDRLFNEM